MKKYLFARNINNTGETGIINPHEQIVICLCDENKSRLIIKALELLDEQPVLKQMAECICEGTFGENESCPACFPISIINIPTK